ncbi:hypothetical protein [Candidatus Uabimicrobium sp. HlEnr_7]|uniref:hypothetical protein n=1 Tax=Candidatus Uabimicrobium helgolandensis TaxID=3095367 RepID=UPI003556E15B
MQTIPKIQNTVDSSNWHGLGFELSVSNIERAAKEDLEKNILISLGKVISTHFIEK